MINKKLKNNKTTKYKKQKKMIKNRLHLFNTIYNFKIINSLLELSIVSLTSTTILVKSLSLILVIYLRSQFIIL